MTREEAIKMLRGMKAENLNIANLYTKDKYNALDMAIKALEQEPILDKIRAEIEQIEINGHIRDVECFRAGINTALNVINKYKAEMESEE